MTDSSTIAPESSELKNGGGDIIGNFKNDFLASIVVFLVALPLCMGIAIASGVPVAAGLITGIVGGLIVGWIAGCPLQVSGPAAGLTVIVFDIVQRFGLEMLGIIVLVGGIIQIAAGVLKLGQWFRAVSPAVIKGMLAGIGVLIFASQFHVMVDDKPKGSGLQNLITIPQAVMKGLAIPEFHSRDARDKQIRALREVGEAHRRQISLRERLAERIPNQAADHSAGGHGFPLLHSSPPDEEKIAEQQAEKKEAIANFKLDADFTAKMSKEQQSIIDQLVEVNNHLDELGLEDQPDKVEEIKVQAGRAIESTRAALASIEDGKMDVILESQADAITALEEMLNKQKNHHLAAFVGVITILIILLWQAFCPKRIKLVPAPLVAIVIATALAAFLAVPILYVEIPDNLASDIRFPSWTLIKDADWSAVFQSGLLIAIVASAETLLCATAVDQMHSGSRTKYDRELVAQGVGNSVCGILGALPMTGVIVRSSANVQAGGQTRASAIMHGAWLLVFVAGLAFLLRMIPTAALAAMLVYTGYKLINPMSILALKKYGWGEVAIFLATVCTIVVTDLLTGVIVGVVLAALKLLHGFSKLDTKLTVDSETKVSTLQINGAATFIRLPVLANRLETVPRGSELHVDFEHLNYIDHACLDLLMNWAKQHETTGGKLVIDWNTLHARFRSEKDPKEPATQ